MVIFYSQYLLLCYTAVKSSPLQHHAYMTLCNLTGSDFSRELLLAPEHHLISNVVALLCIEDYVLSDYKRVVLIRLLWGLSAVADVKSTIVLGHQEVIPELLDIIRRNDPKHNTRSRVWIARLFVRLAESSDLDVIAVLLSCHAHVVFLQILQTVCEFPKEDWGSADGHVQYMLSFVMTLSRQPMSMKPLKLEKTLDIMEPIIFHYPTNGSEALKAMIVTAFLVGRDENTSNILHARPEIITLIVDVLDRTLHGQHGPPLAVQSVVGEGGGRRDLTPANKLEYRFGTFRLHLLLRAVCVMSVSDANKSQLVASDRLLFLLSQRVIGRYLEDCEEIIPPEDSIQPGGGGGNDVESAELAIETLLQLSFVTDQEAAGGQHTSSSDAGEMTPSPSFAMADDNWLLESLDNLLCNSENPQYQKLSHQGIRGVICLRSRLATLIDKKKKTLQLHNREENTDELIQQIPSLLNCSSFSSTTTATTVNTATPLTPRHVMISYCWHEDAKPALVKELSSHLRDTYGYDVWRDEDGSALLSPLRGSTIEHMAQAVELASVVVVCVSRQYKESANCRMEAMYAHQRQLKKKLEIIYIMTQEHYTTQSSVETCDGWLGIMVAEQLWYPLYSSEMVVTAAKGISQRISGHGSSLPVPTEGVSVFSSSHPSSNVVSGGGGDGGGGGGTDIPCVIPSSTRMESIPPVIRDTSLGQDSVLTEDSTPPPGPWRPVLDTGCTAGTEASAHMGAPFSTDVSTSSGSSEHFVSFQQSQSQSQPHFPASPLSAILPLSSQRQKSVRGLPATSGGDKDVTPSSFKASENNSTTHLFCPPSPPSPHYHNHHHSYDHNQQQQRVKSSPRLLSGGKTQQQQPLSNSTSTQRYCYQSDEDGFSFRDADIDTDDDGGANLHLQEAHMCLVDPHNSLVPSETVRLLLVLGIYTPSDLAFLDITEAELLSGYLKLIPGRKFLAKLNNKRT